MGGEGCKDGRPKDYKNGQRGLSSFIKPFSTFSYPLGFPQSQYFRPSIITSTTCPCLTMRSYAVLATALGFLSVAAQLDETGQLEECPIDSAEQCIGPPPPPDTSTDIINNGNYLITNCLYQQPGDLATPLVLKLQAWGPLISKAVSSIVDGGIRPIFTTYFKSQTNVAPVTYILQKIAAGDNLNINGVAQQPTLTCARDGSANPDAQKIWGWCNPPNGNKPAAYQIKGTQTIALCPPFFETPEQPETICPRNLLKLVQNQFGIFVHELVHLYGDQPEGMQKIGGKTFGVGEERYKPDRAKNLLASEQILNPQVC